MPRRRYAIIILRTLKIMAGTRRKARIIALQALYEIDSAGRDPEGVIERGLAGVAMSEENRTFVREMISGTVANREAIDNQIQKLAPAYPIDQLAMVDRNILRLAIFEILYDNKVPVKVTVNEAVELAKTFGNENSARFVNGVLGAAAAQAGRENNS